MNFPDWVSERTKSEKVTKTEVLRALGKKAGVSMLTLQHMATGGKLSRYDKAKAVETATEGLVTVKELCE